MLLRLNTFDSAFPSFSLVVHHIYACLFDPGILSLGVLATNLAIGYHGHKKFIPEHSTLYPFFELKSYTTFMRFHSKSLFIFAILRL